MIDLAAPMESGWSSIHILLAYLALQTHLSPLLPVPGKTNCQLFDKKHLPVFVLSLHICQTSTYSTPVVTPSWQGQQCLELPIMSTTNLEMTKKHGPSTIPQALALNHQTTSQFSFVSEIHLKKLTGHSTKISS